MNKERAAAADGADSTDGVDDDSEAAPGGAGSVGGGVDGLGASGDSEAPVSFAQIVEDAEGDLDMEGANDAMLGVINFVSQKDAPTADDLAATVLEASTPQGVREVVFTELADGRMEEGLRERGSQAQDSTLGIMDVDESSGRRGKRERGGCD